MASVMGFKLAGVTLDMESRGATDYAHALGKGPRRTLTRFAGYLGPGAFGLCAAKLVETGHVVTISASRALAGQDDAVRRPAVRRPGSG